MRYEFECYKWEDYYDAEADVDYERPVLVWRGMAKSRLGAVRNARKALGNFRGALSCFKSGATNYHLLQHNREISRRLDRVPLPRSPEEERMIRARNAAELGKPSG